MVDPARNPDRRPVERAAVSGDGAGTAAGADDCGGDGAVPPHAIGALPCPSCAQSNVGKHSQRESVVRVNGESLAE